MKKLVFASDELPAHLEGPARFKLWHDIYCARFGEADMACDPDRPFFAHCEFMRIGAVGLTRIEANVQRVTRTARQVAADSRDDFFIGFNRGTPQTVLQRGRKIVLDNPGVGIFYTNAEPNDGRALTHFTFAGLCVPRPRVMELVPDAEDLIATRLDPRNQGAEHLMRYTDFLLAFSDIDDSGMLPSHIESTLLDLIALSLGRGEAGENGRLRGLRAANLQAILVQIKARFADPSFSARDVALRLGLTPRYVQNLLGETEVNFTERVLELRLQKARAMLADPRHNRLKVSDIALACGFNEASYFNRCFRRRFGASPTQYRESNGNPV